MRKVSGSIPLSPTMALYKKKKDCMSVNITEQILLLVQLQKLDAEIYTLEKRKREGPLRVKGLEEDFKKRSEVLKDEDGKLKSLQVTQNEKENELASKEENIKKCQSQLNALKTNKEYTTMLQEIGGHEADKSVLEEGILLIMDEVEAQKKEVEKVKGLVKEDENKLNQDKEKVSADIKEIEVTVGTLNKQRSEAAGKIDKAILSKYERLLKGKDSLAMVKVADNACGGCHMNLPPQVINEIKMKIDLIYCESCARILYIEE